MKFQQLIILIFIAASPLKGQTKANKLPNIIIILADDLGYGDLSYLGSKDIHTPHIDKLAHDGMQMVNFYANSTVCSPSRASLMTGRFPDMVGVPGVIRQIKTDSWGYLKEDAVMMPSLLKKRGYQTAMVGKWHLGFEHPNLPNAKGFDLFKGYLADMMDDYYTHLRGGVNWMRFNEKEINPEGHATDIFTNWAVEYLNQQKKNKKPFFLYLAYNAPHFPIQPPASFLEKVHAREKNISEARAKNCAHVEHLDYSIGRVMETLEQNGLDENTLIFFLSDNGGSIPHEQTNGLLRGGKQDMYEGGIKVPAICVWKSKIALMSKMSNPAMLMDILPTLLEVTGMSIAKLVDGMSILPSLKGQPQKTDNRYMYWVRREGGQHKGETYYAMRFGNYKILQNTPHTPFQFFNVMDDPFEKSPLPSDTSTIFKDLISHLNQRIKEAASIPWQKN